MKYDKETLKKDLKFLLSNLEHVQHLQNALVIKVRYHIRWLDWLIKDENTAEEIKNSEQLNSNFKAILVYLSEVEEENKQQKKLTREIIKKFQEQLE